MLRLFYAVILWMYFTMGCLLAPLIAILSFICPHNRYMRNFAWSADKLCAAMLGYTGNHMLSTELAYANKPSWIASFLNVIEPGHCEASAIKEAAYCRLSDRKELGTR